MLRYLEIGYNNFIPSYNLFVGIGIAIAMLFLQYQIPFKAMGEAQKHKIHLSLIISIFLGFIGAFTFDAYSQNIELTFDNLNKIGLTFLGGLISGLIVLVFCLKIFKFPILPTLDFMTLPFCISHFFGRLGCFMAGCCFGNSTNSILGVNFPIDSLPFNHFQRLVNVHPTQLYECAFVLCLFLFFLKYKIKNQFYIYILTYSIFRFTLEFIRADNRGSVLNQNVFTPSQIISIFVVFFLGIFFFMKKSYHKQRYSNQTKG